VSREALVGVKSTWLSRTGAFMISVENIIGLVGGVLVVIYLFIALTHPDWF
jgi:hypothetical protein